MRATASMASVAIPTFMNDSRDRLVRTSNPPRASGIDFNARHPMSKKHVYVLGINAYDHDVSACLLRDGEIAFAINKERITREKHDTGFYQEVVDYCLAAENISLDDVDLVVRNCYVLPVQDLETRMVSQDVPEVMDDHERSQAAKNPLFLSRSNRVVTVSHHLAHAYSAFAVCPFSEGVVMVV